MFERERRVENIEKHRNSERRKRVGQAVEFLLTDSLKEGGKV